MGDIAEMMLHGILCGTCGAFLNGDATGYPCYCDGCEPMSAKKESKLRRASNRVNSRKLLLDNGVTFIERNDGSHLIVSTPDGEIDFWPGTGKYIRRSDKKEGRGVFNLLELLNIKEEQ